MTGLESYRQFILYIVRPSSTRPGKTDKFPINPYTGEVANAHDTAIQMHHIDAQTLFASGVGNGVGFVFTDRDPFFFLDIDNARLPSGEWTPLAVELCQQFAGCFVEVSVSGNGLHIIGTGSVPAHGTVYKGGTDDDIQLYTSKRFCALTLAGSYGSAQYPAQHQLEHLVSRFFTPTVSTTPAEWTSGPCAEWSGFLDDNELISKMLNSKTSVGAVFGGKATVVELWYADAAALGKSYPDSRPEGFDRSSADAALCAHLAFWTGKDCARMDRIFRMSLLYRDKWETRPDYRQRTILHAVGHCRQVYSGGRRSEIPMPPEGAAVDTLSGYQYLGITSQVEHFAGCVYIRSEDAIFTPDGALLKPSQFRSMYGGFDFALDTQGDKSTKSAWEAFTECRNYRFPKAHEMCFRPEHPSGAVIEENGTTMVNTYVPIITPRVAGDPSRWLDHVARLLPNPHDRAILLSYMAAMVQYPGRKFYWSPVIQGCQGNGKTLLTTTMEFCVGNRYSHRPNPEDIGNKFNAWIIGKLFVAVEEAYVSDRQEMISVLKILIGNDRVDIQGKGANQRTGDNRANFLMCTNHQDAIRLKDDDRRFSVFFTAQQDREDLHRDGMDGDYFPSLYAWLRDDGYAIVNDYLHTYQIPDELNPATHCHRAPPTSSTTEAISLSLGSVEQEIVEAIEEGLPGFCGGWVSSLALDRRLDEKRLSSKVPRCRRRALMQSIGYDYHPGLKDGRVNNPVIENGIAGKPKLYIRKGHLAAHLTTGSEIVRVYTEAQQGALSVANIILGQQQNNC